MLPDIKKIRDSVKCHVAALPICYRTNEKQPTFFNLEDHNNCDCPAPHGRAFPTALDPLYCNRYEIRKFIKEVHSIKNLIAINKINKPKTIFSFSLDKK